MRLFLKEVKLREGWEELEREGRGRVRQEDMLQLVSQENVSVSEGCRNGSARGS